MDKQGNWTTIFRMSVFALAFASAPVVYAQTGAPGGGGMAPGGAGLSTTNPGVVANGNNSGGTAPAPVYSGPAAASGANSPPVNSGITDPHTGANNDTRPMNDTQSSTTTSDQPNH
jgi:hypothetical protein